MSNRKDLINQVKALNVETPRPPHMMKTEDLQNFIASQNKPEKLSMRTRILQLNKEGKTKKEIQNLLENEGWAGKVRCGKVRPGYIYTVLRNNS